MGQTIGIVYVFFTILLAVYSYFIFTRSKNDMLVFGFIIGLLYFNIIPFSAFLLNDGTTGLLYQSDAKWAKYSHIMNDPDVLNYYFGLFVMLLSIQLFTNAKVKRVVFFNKKNRYSVTVKKIVLLLISFVGMNIVKDSMIPSGVTHWAEKADYFNSHYGLLANIYNFFLTGIKFYFIIVATNLFRQRLFFSIGILFFVAFIDLIFTANRIFSLVVGLTILLMLVEQRKYIYASIFSFVSAPLVFFMVLWPYIRSTMSYSSFGNALQKSLTGLDIGNNMIFNMIFSITEGADFLVSYTIIKDFPNIYDYFFGSTILKIFTVVIPRSIWIDKWNSASIEIANIYHPGTEGFSLAPTLLGEIFANGGYIALLVVPFLLLYILANLFRFLEKWTSGLDFKYFAFGIAFLCMRSNFSDVFILLISVMTFVIFVYTISKKRIVVKNRYRQNV